METRPSQSCLSTPRSFRLAESPTDIGPRASNPKPPRSYRGRSTITGTQTSRRARVGDGFSIRSHVRRGRPRPGIVGAVRSRNRRAACRRPRESRFISGIPILRSPGASRGRNVVVQTIRGRSRHCRQSAESFRQVGSLHAQLACGSGRGGLSHLTDRGRWSRTHRNLERKR